MGVMYHGYGEYEKAAQAFEEGLLCALRSNHGRIEALTSVSLGDLYAEVEGFEVAYQNYQRAAELIQSMDDRFLIHALGLSQINLALLKNDPESARQRIGEVSDSIRSGNARFENGLLELFYGRLSLLVDEPAKAILSLEKAKKYFLEDERKLEVAICQVWLAAAHLQNGDTASSVEKIKSINSGNIHNPILIAVHQARIWLEGLPKDRDLARLFAQVSRLSEKLPSVRRDLRRQAHVMQVPAPHISIQALGRAQVSIGSKLLTSTDWQTQSVRDLFFYFLRTNKPLTKEQIGETLWPDQYDTSRLRLRFKNDIYRLRRAVGQEAILFEDAFYSFNRNLDYEYDVEAFEAYVTRARSAQSPLEQIELYKKAVDLVHGQYLDDSYMNWVIPDRERLGQMTLNSLAALAELHLRQAQPEEALTACQRVIEYDSVFEPAYRLSMLAYDRLDDKSSITRVYLSCREACMKQFNLPPSKEIDDLYYRLIM